MIQPVNKWFHQLKISNCKIQKAVEIKYTSYIFQNRGATFESQAAKESKQFYFELLHQLLS